MAPPKRPKTVRERVAMQSAGMHHESVDAIKRAEAVAAVVSGRIMMREAAKAYGIAYSTIHKWIREDHYQAIAERYEEKLYELQEAAVLSVEKSIEAMNQIAERAADPEWLAKSDPERIKAMADLFKSQSDTVIRFFEAIQRAAVKGGASLVKSDTPAT